MLGWNRFGFWFRNRFWFGSLGGNQGANRPGGSRNSGTRWSRRRGGCRGFLAARFDQLDEDVALFRLDAAELVFDIPALRFAKINQIFAIHIHFAGYQV